MMERSLSDKLALLGTDCAKANDHNINGKGSRGDMPFRFFDLPRELHNNVYDRIKIKKGIRAVKPNGLIIVQRYPRTELLLVVPQLEALRSLRLEIRGDLDAFEEAIAHDGFDHRHFLTANILPKQQKSKGARRVTVNKAYCLESDLYSANEDVIGDSALASQLEDSDDNMILYYAKASKDSACGWHGLDLRTLRTGAFK
ncbi:hypothetical protein LTR36_004048 [Oleoguttula mirabilis]|uniref:Uncharacterized protein n=1 Tax=Oleoguttula mirabilis TaxID=1507867 RepID=A0AAV9JIQ0_9PEZI|nr:hypothetical protein LTR36_004048 [Oleoguttula mirabilis]